LFSDEVLLNSGGLEQNEGDPGSVPGYDGNTYDLNETDYNKNTVDMKNKFILVC
jgi:hypothetical protein